MSKSLAPTHLETGPNCSELCERDERLESLNSLVGKLVHDFNNFLVPLLGYVALLKEELPAGSAALVYANTLETTARKTEGSLDQILMAVRPYRSFHPKPTDFSQLICSALNDWRNTLPAGASIVVREDISPCTLTVDEAQWRRVLVQLLSNARFALATGGTLEISLRPQTLDSTQMLDLKIAVPEVFRLVFRDHGFGMSPAVLKRACEPFFTTRGSIGAAGLGLTMAHSVAQQHGGQIQIESAEDMGTTVTIWIPTSLVRQAGASWRDEKRGAVLNPLQGNQRTRILLVEDDPLIREVLKPYLQRTGYEVSIAPNGEEGLKLFRRYPHHWALIISDLDLPRTSDGELHTTFLTEDPEVRIILVTGDTQATVAEAPETLSTRRPLVIKKPFTLKSFNEVIRTHLGQKL